MKPPADIQDSWRYDGFVTASFVTASFRRGSCCHGPPAVGRCEEISFFSLTFKAPIRFDAPVKGRCVFFVANAFCNSCILLSNLYLDSYSSLVSSINV